MSGVTKSTKRARRRRGGFVGFGLRFIHAVWRFQSGARGPAAACCPYIKIISFFISLEKPSSSKVARSNKKAKLFAIIGGFRGKGYFKSLYEHGKTSEFDRWFPTRLVAQPFNIRLSLSLSLSPCIASDSMGSRRLKVNFLDLSRSVAFGLPTRLSCPAVY